MKKLILVLCLIIIPFVSFCQRLSLDELVTIYKMDQTQTEEFMNSKNWDEEDTIIEGESEYGILRWSYGKHILGVGDYEGSRIRVMYQSYKTNIDAVKEKAISLKMVKKKSGMDAEGTIFSIYVGANYALKFIRRFDGTNMVTIVAKDYLKSL